MTGFIYVQEASPQKSNNDYLLVDRVTFYSLKDFRSSLCYLYVNKRSFSTSCINSLLLNKIEDKVEINKNGTQLLELNPWTITGFIDAEGSFMLNINQNLKLKVGWRVQPSFRIGLHKKDEYLLEYIRNYFGVGKIYVNKNVATYVVESLNDLDIIVNHIQNYPLLTQKYSDFILFEKGLEIVKAKGHLTQEGIEKLISLKVSLNYGLSKKLEEAHPHVIPESKVFYSKEISDPNWLNGFVSGDGCFFVKIYPAKTKLKEAVMLFFQVTQHIKDEALLRSCSTYLNCGRVAVLSNSVQWHVTKFSDITDIIIPFFNKYPIIGVKYQDFKDFCLVSEIMKNKGHLTQEGLKQIHKIKDRMNANRYN